MTRRLYTDNTYRACSRCGKELTDPASRECGVGPVCRKKDNHLYAKLIQANIPMATALILGTHTEELPLECGERFMTASKSFVKKMAKLQEANEDETVMKLTGADFREEVRALDYILSYSLDSVTRTKLVNIIRHLGYVGLAAVLSGEASKSKAKVYFEGGRICLKGTGCTSGFHKMRKIRGIKTPRYRGSKEPYSAPASQAEEFLAVVIEHWPLYEGTLDDLRTEVSAWTKKNGKAIKTENAALAQEDLLGLATTASLKMRTDDFVLSFKWLNGADIKGMLGRLKKIDSKERSYNPNTKNWMFRKQHLDTVKKIVAKVYEAVVILESEDETPQSDWVKRNPYPNRRRRGGYRRSNFYRY